MLVKIYIFKSPVNNSGLQVIKYRTPSSDSLDGPVSKHGSIVLEGNGHRLRESKLNKCKPVMQSAQVQISLSSLLSLSLSLSFLSLPLLYTYLVGCVSSPAILTYFISPHG